MKRSETNHNRSANFLFSKLSLIKEGKPICSIGLGFKLPFSFMCTKCAKLLQFYVLLCAAVMLLLEDKWKIRLLLYTNVDCSHQ